MQVIDEITDLIQDRIGSGLAPTKIEIEAEGMGDKDDSPMTDGMGMQDGSSDDDADLAKLWEGEGMSGEKMDDDKTGMDDDEEMMRKLKGM